VAQAPWEAFKEDIRELFVERLSKYQAQAFWRTNSPTHFGGHTGTFTSIEEVGLCLEVLPLLWMKDARRRSMRTPTPSLGCAARDLSWKVEQERLRLSRDWRAFPCARRATLRRWASSGTLSMW
jgi:hypothetical protein